MLTLVDVVVFIIGVAIISKLILDKVRLLYNQVEMFKRLGGPDAASYVPSKKEVKKLVSSIVQETKKRKEKDEENEKNNCDKGMYG